MAVNEEEKVVLTTHQVVIDADDKDHARRLVQALKNDGYRIHREIREWIERGGMISIKNRSAHDG